MKRYIFKVIISEGDDEFWDSLGDSSRTDEVTEWLKEVIYPDNNVEIKLMKYENIPDEVNHLIYPNGYEQLTF